MEPTSQPAPPDFILDTANSSHSSLASPPAPPTLQVVKPTATLTRGVPLAPPLPQEEAVIEPPGPRGRGFLGRLGMAEWLLKYRGYLLEQIRNGKELEVILVDLLLVAALPTAAYGLVTGLATNSLARILTNPFKLPVLLVLTTFLCLPTLYIFASYLGSRRTFAQMAALAFSSIAIVGVVLAAFAPITWFLTFTAPGAYALHVLVNVAVLALSGFMGVGFLFHGIRKLQADAPDLRRQTSFMGLWVALYGLVGAQMGWMLRPFFSPSDVLFRGPSADGGNVFAAIWTVLQRVFQ